MRHAEIAALESAFDPAAFYVPAAETLEEETSRPEGGHFNVVQAMMLRISGDTVDSGPLLQWAEHLDLLETLKQARNFSPD